MSAFKDHFSGHAADYRLFRPTYPPDRPAAGFAAAWGDPSAGRVVRWKLTLRLGCATGRNSL